MFESWIAYFKDLIKKDKDSKLEKAKQREYILKALPIEKERRARTLIKELSNVNSFSDIKSYYGKHTELNTMLKDAIGIVRSDPKTPKSIKSSNAVQLIDAGSQNYMPATSGLYSLFHNPFAVYSFIVRNHAAVHSAISVIRDEIVNDGYVLISEKGLAKKRMREVYRLLKSHKIGHLRVEMAAQLKTYGNCWLYYDKRSKELILLSPTKILPVIDPRTDKIVAWDYIVGATTKRYMLNDLMHLYLFSSDGYSGIGDPPLGPALVDIEADMAASAFNNEVFKKGGLMGIILDIEPPVNDPLADDANDLVEDLQDRIDAQYSGMKTGQSVLVTTNLKSVHNVSKIGELEGSWQSLRMEAAKTISVCLGVPPEKIAISRSSTLQYIPSLVEDSVNAQFDKSMFALTEVIDDFLNESFLRGILKIDDIMIEAGGRYGSLTKNAADTIKVLADAGPIITINEALDRILGWEPLSADNPRGQLVLDNSDNRDMNSTLAIQDPAKPNYDLGKGHGFDDVTFTSGEEEMVNFVKIKRGRVRFFQHKSFKKDILNEGFRSKNKEDKDQPS